MLPGTQPVLHDAFYDMSIMHFWGPKVQPFSCSCLPVLPILLSLLQQFIPAVEYCHSHSVAHRWVLCNSCSLAVWNLWSGFSSTAVTWLFGTCGQGSP